MRRDHKSHMKSSHRSVFTFVPNFRGFSLTPNLSKEQRIEKKEEEQAKYKQKKNAVPTIFFSHRPSKKPRLNTIAKNNRKKRYYYVKARLTKYHLSENSNYYSS